MYKISIPVVLHDRFDKEATLSELRRAGAHRVFLALGAPSMSAEIRKKDLVALRENIPFFKAAGLEVGVWFWTFWRNDVICADEMLMTKPDGSLRITEGIVASEKISGISGFGCPASETFVGNSMEIIREYAECRPDILMFDDDYRFGFIDKHIGCYCNAHMKMYRERLGYEISREDMYKKVFDGKPSRERSVYLECLGESLESFAKRVRETVDSVDPTIRFAVCSCMSLWDMDGTDSARIAKILAGNTRPIMRQIGAPYWAERKSWGNRLQNVIELERMEHYWSEGEDVEIMTEGDVYPRPRNKIPSAFLEGFDTALRAADVGEYVHKYMIDYTSSPTYETGYVNAHLHNAPAYKAIERIFGGKKTCGVGVYEKMKKFADADLTDIAEPEEYVKDLFFSKGARLLADNTVPLIYGEDCDTCVVFGENARDLPESIAKKHLILDIRAAKLLTEQGMDVGLESIGGRIKPELLYYIDQNEYTVSDYGEDSAYEIKTKPEARVLVYSVKGETRYTDAYAYKNASGQSFTVFAFDAALAGKHRFRTYAMQKLLYSEIERMQGKPLPVKCAGNPDLYVLAKKDGDSMAVGLWNFCIDPIYEPVVELDREYSEVEYFGCTGRQEGNKLYLSRLGAYEFAFVDLK